MKITPSSVVSELGAGRQVESAAVPAPGGKPFSSVLKETRVEQIWTALTNPSSFKELAALQSRILHSHSIAPRELILYQVKASNFGLGIELVSKVAESVSTSIRKFQNNP